MKLAFLRTKISIVVIGLIVGLAAGFKIANSQYRREQSVALSQAVAAAANGVSGQGMSPEQQNQMISQVRATVDKATNNPQDFDAQLQAADQFIQINRPEESLKFLEQANKIRPNDAQTTGWLGMANVMVGKYDEAIKWSKQSITLEPKNPGATFVLIAAYSRTRQNLGEAERLLNQLESQGIDREMVSQARRELNAAKSQAPGNDSSPKSVLDHGPADPKPDQAGKNAGKTADKTADKTGGPR